MPSDCLESCRRRRSADELQLQAGRDLAFESITTSIAAATGAGAAEWSICPLANVTLCAALEAAVPVVFVQVSFWDFISVAGLV